MLIFVERAKACIVPARMAQFDASFRGKIHDIDFGFNFINDGHTSKIIDSIEWNRKSTEPVSLSVTKGLPMV
jgi:hypothetical protein